MGQFNPLAASRYADMMRRWLGEDLDVSSVAPELLPVVVLEDDPDDLAILKQERLWTDLTSLGAQPAATNGLAVVNPVGSQIISRVELILPSVDTVQMGIGNLAFAPINAGYTFSRNVILSDTRLTPKTQNGALGTTQIFQKIAGAFVGGPVNTGRVPPNVQAFLKFVLAPGMYLIAEQTTVNTFFAVMTIGRERQARPEELFLL